jgi:hypothetical protein
VIQKEKNLLWPYWQDFLKGKQHCKFIAYGTLINKHSIGKTIDRASLEGVAIAFGVRRVFKFALMDENFRDHGGLYERSAEHNHCATLNLLHTRNSHDKVNGVLFSIKPDGIDALAKREYGYDVVPVEYEQANAKGSAYMFIARKESQAIGHRVLDDILPNESSLATCLTGAATYGKTFLDMWVASCYLADGTPLVENRYYRNLVEDFLETL